MAEYDAGLMKFTWLCSLNPSPSPFMPRLKPLVWSLRSPNPYWLYGEFVPLCADAVDARADRSTAVRIFFIFYFVSIN